MKVAAALAGLAVMLLAGAGAGESAGVPAGPRTLTVLPQPVKSFAHAGGGVVAWAENRGRKAVVRALELSQRDAAT